jgi:hypothetical protein
MALLDMLNGFGQKNILVEVVCRGRLGMETNFYENVVAVASAHLRSLLLRSQLSPPPSPLTQHDLSPILSLTCPPTSVNRVIVAAGVLLGHSIPVARPLTVMWLSMRRVLSGPKLVQEVLAACSPSPQGVHVIRGLLAGIDVAKLEVSDPIHGAVLSGLVRHMNTLIA